MSASRGVFATGATPPDAGARGTGGGGGGTATAVVVAVAAAAAAARPVRPAARAPVPAVRAEVLRAPVQQLGPVRAGRRLRDRRRVRVPFLGGRQRAGTARPHRPPQERLSRRTLEHHRLVGRRDKRAVDDDDRFAIAVKLRYD